VNDDVAVARRLPTISLAKEGSKMTLGSGLRAVLLKAACLGLVWSGMTAAQAGQLNEVNPAVGFSSVSRAYPGMNPRYARTGTPREIAQLRRIAVGQSRSNLQAILGRPALNNDDGSYEFHLSLPLTRRDRLICQYRVFFDGEGRVSRAVWRRPQCADLVAGKRN